MVRLQSDDVVGIEAMGLTKRFGEVPAVLDVNLAVHPGEMCALLGRNGAGKTTLFSMLATLRSPCAGSAKLFGYDVVTQRQEVRRILGIVFQDSAIEQRVSSRDNLMFLAVLHGLSRSATRNRVAELLQFLHLESVAERAVKTLSGGQRRKLELARALIAEPRVLLLDEPTLGLDVDARSEFWGRVTALADRGCTVLFSTHYMEEAAIANRIALMDSGRIVAVDAPEVLRSTVIGIVQITTDDDRRARQWIKEHGFEILTDESCIMIRHADPSLFLPQLLQSLPIPVRRASIVSPSLEEVFIAKTSGAASQANVLRTC